MPPQNIGITAESDITTGSENTVDDKSAGGAGRNGATSCCCGNSLASAVAPTATKLVTAICESCATFANGVTATIQIYYCANLILM